MTNDLDYIKSIPRDESGDAYMIALTYEYRNSDKLKPFGFLNDPADKRTLLYVFSDGTCDWRHCGRYDYRSFLVGIGANGKFQIEETTGRY